MARRDIKELGTLALYATPSELLHLDYISLLWTMALRSRGAVMMDKRERDRHEHEGFGLSYGELAFVISIFCRSNYLNDALEHV